MSTRQTPSASAALPAPRSNRVGATIGGKYRVRRLLGHGGMGSVYEADDPAIGRTVAIKVLHGHLADDGVALTRFQREARMAASVGHPHVVEVLDVGVEPGGAPYIVMEYVRGKSLSKALRDGGPLAPERAADIAGQILDGLSALHDRGVVHRDLKPENVLLTARQGRSDFVKLLDFGVATYVEGVQDVSHVQDLTPSGRAMGTPHYASPEQINGSGGRDARVDLYAAGVILYEMLTGRRPFWAPSFLDLCRAILDQDPPPMRVFRTDVPAELEEVVRRALAKDPEARWPHARAMLEALIPFGASRPTADPEPTDAFTADLRELRMREEVLGAAGRTGDGEPPPSGDAGLPRGVVRGEVVIAMLALLRERVGEQRLEELIDRLEPATAASIRQGCAPDGWYGDDTLDLLEVADREIGRGDRELLAEAGRYFARNVFGASRDLPSKSVTPEYLFSTSGELWKRCFAQGEAGVVNLRRGYGRIEVRGQVRPRLARSVAIVGYLDEALRIAGAIDADVRLTRSAALGDPLDVLEATWSS